MCGETLATYFSGPFCGCSDGDGTTSILKHLIFLLLYSCAIIKPGSIVDFGRALSHVVALRMTHNLLVLAVPGPSAWSGFVCQIN